MATARESYSLWKDWKRNRERFWRNLGILLFIDVVKSYTLSVLQINRGNQMFSKYERKVIWIDSFRTPFNKNGGVNYSDIIGNMTKKIIITSVGSVLNMNQKTNI